MALLPQVFFLKKLQRFFSMVHM